MTKRTCNVLDCPEQHHCKGFCRPHYMRFWKYGDPLAGGPIGARLPKTTPRNFWTRVDKNGPPIATRPDLGPCWPWRGSLNIGGYARCGRQKPHRDLWVERNGEVPAGLELDHLCHTFDLSCRGGKCAHRRCINPDHLEPVTHHENQIRGVKGRALQCLRGHDLAEVGVRGGHRRRACLTCRAENRQALRDQIVITEESSKLTPTSAVLAELAEVYSSASATDRPARLAVAMHFGRPLETVSDWIAKARREGYLPAVTIGPHDRRLKAA